MRPFDNPAMAHRLLSIALTVEQHDNGNFYWILLESFDYSMEFESLMESATGFTTYIEALEAGFAMLKKLPGDLRLGPQDETDDYGEYA
jgi:hypothetical protein